METRKTMCRVCSILCSIEVDIEDGRVVATRGDTSDPMHGGYTCIKGQQIIEQHEHPDRLRGSVKKGADGVFRPIASEQATDEIAAKLKDIIAKFGPRSVAVYMGTQGGITSGNHALLCAWTEALGSPNFYSPMSVDQPAKFWVAPARHGVWSAGVQHIDTADVTLVVGANPLVSHWSPRGGLVPYNAYHRLRESKKRGMKLIVIDPRRTELARHADLHLRVKPGEDPTLLAGIIRVVIAENLYDKAFCDRYTVGFEGLRAAVNDYTPEYVERRTGVPAQDVIAAARMFGHGPRGSASAGTGPDMAPRANLAAHLLVALNSLCGRYRRGGEKVWDLEVLSRTGREVARVIPPWHDKPPPVMSRVRNLRGCVTNAPGGGKVTEMPSAALADEILMPGDGQIRALLCIGGNPIVAFPNQAKVRRAFESLDLLVAADIKLSATSKLAHYIIAPKLSLERADISTLMDARSPTSYAQYTDALIKPDFDVVEEWDFIHGLCRRMGTQVQLPGGELPLDRRLTKLELLKLVFPDPRISWDRLVATEGGRVYPELATTIVESDAPSDARLDFTPSGIVEELREVRAEPFVAGGGYGAEGTKFTHRLTCRRVAYAHNSSSRDMPRAQKKGKNNPAFMNPADLKQLGLQSGDMVEISSDYDSIPAIVEGAGDILPGSISMTHAFGDVPELDGQIKEIGVCVTRLVDDETNIEPFYGMPRFTGIPVNVKLLRRVAAK